MFHASDEFLCNLGSVFHWCKGWQLAMDGIKFKRAGDAHGPHVGNVEIIASIVVFCQSAVPCVDALGSPRCACECRRMDDGTGPGRGHGVGVPIVFCTMELLVG